MRILALAPALWLLAAPASPVVTWIGGNDAYTLTITESGEATYQGHSGGWGLPATPPPPRHLRLRPDEVQRLRELLAKNKVLELRRSDRPFKPEEHDDALTVAFKGLEGHVSLPADDWQATPRAKACEDALSAIADRVSKAPVKRTAPSSAAP